MENRKIVGSGNQHVPAFFVPLLLIAGFLVLFQSHSSIFFLGPCRQVFDTFTSQWAIQFRISFECWRVKKKTDENEKRKNISYISYIWNTYKEIWHVYVSRRVFFFRLCRFRLFACDRMDVAGARVWKGKTVIWVGASSVQYHSLLPRPWSYIRFMVCEYLSLTK